MDPMTAEERDDLLEELETARCETRALQQASSPWGVGSSRI